MSVESGVGAPRGQRAAPTDPAAVTPSPEPLIPRARPRARRPEGSGATSGTAPVRSLIRGRRQPRRGRRVRRVIRRIELWSVLKVSLIFNLVMLGVALISVALLWGLANTTGLVDDLEGFLRDAGFDDFRFEGDRMFRRVAFLGALLALAFSVFTVLATALVNLISELTGGIRVVIIEEIVERPAARTSRTPGDTPPRSRPPGPPAATEQGPRPTRSSRPAAGPPSTWPGRRAPGPPPGPADTGPPRSS